MSADGANDADDDGSRGVDDGDDHGDDVHGHDDHDADAAADNVDHGGCGAEADGGRGT